MISDASLGVSPLNMENAALCQIQAQEMEYRGVRYREPICIALDGRHVPGMFEYSPFDDIMRSHSVDLEVSLIDEVKQIEEWQPMRQ